MLPPYGTPASILPLAIESSNRICQAQCVDAALPKLPIARLISGGKGRPNSITCCHDTFPHPAHAADARHSLAPRWSTSTPSGACRPFCRCLAKLYILPLARARITSYITHTPHLLPAQRSFNPVQRTSGLIVTPRKLKLFNHEEAYRTFFP